MSAIEPGNELCDRESVTIIAKKRQDRQHVDVWDIIRGDVVRVQEACYDDEDEVTE